MLSAEEKMNRLICGDSTEVLRTLPSGDIDLVITSPPYDSLRYYGRHAWDFEGTASELRRCMKVGGVIVWIVGDQTLNGSETGTSFRQALHFITLGFNLHDTMIYTTNKPPQSLVRYHQLFEYMFVFSLGPPKTFNPMTIPCEWAGVGTSPRQRDKAGILKGGKKDGRRLIKETKVRSNIWHYETGQGKTVSLGHPATFPLQLAVDHILSWSNERDLVVDPFCGSGTTCRAAIDNGRRYVGIEINPDYISISKKRLTQKVLF